MIKPSPIKRKGIKRHVGHLKRATGRIKPKKGQSKGLPSWIKAIPEGRHGSGTLQKRLWRLTSDFVRIRDFIVWGTFVDTIDQKMNDWNHAQAGHYRSYQECHAMFKFHEMNIHAQTPIGNSFPSSSLWDRYADNLVKRYGPDFINALDYSNKPENYPSPITKEMVLHEIERKLKLISMLRIKPPYYERVMTLRATQQSESNNKTEMATNQTLQSLNKESAPKPSKE